MKPYSEGEMEGRRGRSNANRIIAGTGASRRGTGTGTTRRTPRNGDIDIDRYPSWRQHQQTTQQGSAASNITRTRAATTAQHADATSFVRGSNQAVAAPAQETTAGNNNFTQDDDTYASLTSSQDQARWNDMIIPDSISPAGATPTSRLGCDDDYYNKKKNNKIEEAKAEEQAVWDGMLVHGDTAISSAIVTDTSSGNPNSNNNKKEVNGQNQGGEQAEETQQNDSRSDNVVAAGAATTDSSPPAATPTAGAFAVCGDETVQRGGEADTFTQVSEVGTAARYTEENSASTTNQTNEDGSPVVVQAHLVANDSQHEQRIQQLEAMVRQQQQQLQQPTAPLVHAEIASAAPEETFDNNRDEMPPPSPPVSEQEQQTERRDKGAIRSWIVKNRRNRCVALGLLAVVVVVAVVAIAVPLSNSSSVSSSSSNKGVASNNNSTSTGPPSTISTPFSEEPSIAPTTNTGSPVVTSPPTVALTETISPPPTVAATTQNPTRLPTRRPTSPPTTALPTTDGSPSPSPPPPTPVALLPDGPWKPLGQELGGKAERDDFGVSVSLSRDARVLAVGANQHPRLGYVSIFELDVSTWSWVAMGQELVGEANGDNFGGSVALNGDGTIVAVGAWWNDGGGTNAGHVRVFEHDTNTNRWVQLGSDIDGEAALDWFGHSVSSSKAGDILAVGAYRHDEWRGSVHVFQYNRENDSWEPLGQTLVGQAKDDAFGISVSLSSSGEIVAVGARRNDSGGTNAGQVSMYQYNSASFEWDPMGSPINGQIVSGNFGESVSLDDSGMIVAVGAPSFSDDERVLVYAYDSAKSEWVQRGQTLASQQQGDNDFGDSVSLSGNGNVLAVGSMHHDSNGLTNSGQVAIFQYNANTMEWDAVGEPLNGKAERDQFGGSVSLSEDGTVVAVGAYGRDFNGNSSAGSASVYTLN